jgi:hypothetical protein
MLVVIFRLRQLRFGQRPAFIRREHCTAPGHLADTFIAERPSGRLCNTAHKDPLNLWRRPNRTGRAVAAASPLRVLIAASDLLQEIDDPMARSGPRLGLRAVSPLYPAAAR